AAVYYVIAQEIDREPAALFRLRGFELEHGAAASDGTAEKGAPGTSRKRGADAPTPPTARLPDPLPVRFVASWDDAPLSETGAGSGSELPRLAPYSSLVPKLLPPGPPLAGLDLRVGLEEFHHALARGWEEPLMPRARKRDDGDRAEARRRALATGEWRIFVTGRDCDFETPSGERLRPLDAAVLALESDRDSGSASWVFLRRFALALRALVAAGAIHPALDPKPDGFAVLWKPAAFGADVRSWLDWVAAAAVPPESTARGGTSSVPDRSSVPLRESSASETSSVPKRNPVPDRASLLALLAAAFLRDYVPRLRFSPTGAYAAASPVSRALFEGATVDARVPALRSLPAALAARFSVYELAAGEHGLELLVRAAPGRRPADADAEPGRRYRLEAGVAAADGKRVPIHEAAGTLGSGALAFPALLSAFVPELAALGTRAGVMLDEEALGRLVTGAAPLLARLGVPVVLPKELARLARPRPVLAAKRRRGAASLASALDLASAFSFEWKVELGGELVDLAEFEALVARGRALQRFRDSWVRLDPGEAAALLERLRRREAPDAGTALRALMEGEVEEGSAFAEGVAALLARGRAAADPARLPLPAGLAANLRPYQDRGFRWLAANFAAGFGCLLADDMGLGKTVQAIALMLLLKEGGQLGRGALVIAPASLLTNWERELARFAPTLRVALHYGAGRRAAKKGPEPDVLLTTYETFLRDRATLAAREWDLALLDEAHLVKNPDAARSKAVKTLKAARRLALTGTPVENNLAELWSIFDFALPGWLGSLEDFAREFRAPIEVSRDAEAAARLRRVTAPFILRRLKTDRAIAPDLPEKSVIAEYAELTAEQAALYKVAVERGMAAVESAGPGNRSGQVLAMLTALKQISNHPRNWDKESPGDAARSGKSRLLLSLLDSAFEAGERVLVFSQYVEMLEILAPVVRENLGVEPELLHGGMTKARRDQAVDRFQNGTGPGAFLVSLKAGGVGLNLTAATRVFHYDLWYNPAVENQATDRAFRIGQTKNVFVHRLIA
ncbi:MAG TPA: DEAD/DEAH box helicase, partial [Spirochaetales bacterium]|nr:DEAD/DEAH box helicase [Spirochaetales bacterium]